MFVISYVREPELILFNVRHISDFRSHERRERCLSVCPCEPLGEFLGVIPPAVRSHRGSAGPGRPAWKELLGLALLADHKAAVCYW